MTDQNDSEPNDSLSDVQEAGLVEYAFESALHTRIMYSINSQLHKIHRVQDK